MSQSSVITSDMIISPIHRDWCSWFGWGSWLCCAVRWTFSWWPSLARRICSLGFDWSSGNDVNVTKRRISGCGQSRDWHLHASHECLRAAEALYSIKWPPEPNMCWVRRRLNWLFERIRLRRFGAGEEVLERKRGRDSRLSPVRDKMPSGAWFVAGVAKPRIRCPDGELHGPSERLKPQEP